MSAHEAPNKLRPTSDPPIRSTCAPIGMAMGIAMTAWGLMALSLNINALWLMTATGIGLSAWSLKMWIHEIVLTWEASR